MLLFRWQVSESAGAYSGAGGSRAQIGLPFDKELKT
jgi:hypothetical protein